MAFVFYIFSVFPKILWPVYVVYLGEMVYMFKNSPLSPTKVRTSQHFLFFVKSFRQGISQKKIILQTCYNKLLHNY